MNSLKKGIGDLVERVGRAYSSTFTERMMEVYEWQSKVNPIFSRYVHSLRHPHPNMPVFLPISAFKTHVVKSGRWDEESVFLSSSTTGLDRSRHYLRDSGWYNQVATSFFESVYGPLDNWRILALLPSYSEQQNSSLLHMINHFIKQTGDPYSGFYHGRISVLIERLLEDISPRKTLLWGVSYALLDLAESWKEAPLGKHVQVLETGGMKGRRRELPKDVLHERLRSGLGGEEIHSEYGMTELLSQAYMHGEDVFVPAPTMRVMVREVNDPFAISAVGRGALNIVDLANVDTCSFIETEDMGEVYEDGSFKVFGRLDNTQMRGCNLLYTEM